MSRAAVFTLAAVGLGFLVGFAWGRGAREELPGATDTSYTNGVLTVRVNAYQALGAGLLRGWS